jgi:hypothetical protein
MSVAEVLKQVEILPREERAGFASQVLRALYPDSEQSIARLMRRLENPDVPEDFWEAVEESEDGKAIEITDEHFEQPPF